MRVAPEEKHAELIEAADETNSGIPLEGPAEIIQDSGFRECAGLRMRPIS